MRVRQPKSTKVSLQELADDFGLWEQEVAEARARTLGKNVLRWYEARRLRNNDDLAHVRQLAENGGWNQSLLRQVYVDYITDMGERAPDMCHYHRFSMHIDGDDIVSADGVRMKQSMRRSLEATRLDIEDNQARSYGLERELVQFDHIDGSLQQLRGCGYGRQVGFASLCPPDSELDASVARINGFKPERLLASIWIYEKNNGNDVTMHAFSLEHCTLERLQRLLDVCGVEHQVATGTLDQLGRLIDFSATSVEDLRLMWRHILAEDGLVANSDAAEQKVRSREEAFKLYIDFVDSIESSLRGCRPTKQLRGLLNSTKVDEFVRIGASRGFCVEDAERIMGFVRSRMIPHYIYGQRLAQGSVGDVLEASKAAAARPEAYDGSCPSSMAASKTETSGNSLTSFMERVEHVLELTMHSWKGDCLGCGAQRTQVHGCGLCSRCNRRWSSAYLRDGTMLSLKELARMTKPARKIFEKGSKDVVKKAKKFKLLSFWQ